MIKNKKLLLLRFNRLDFNKLNFDIFMKIILILNNNL